jgi:hypothetical protein
MLLHLDWKASHAKQSVRGFTQVFWIPIVFFANFDGLQMLR